MPPGETQARHVFHAPITGWDRIHSWQVATGEPVFIWGRRSQGADGLTFGPIKRAFRNWLSAHPESLITVYHDGIGADALGPLDPAPHKVTFLHHWFPRWERHFAWFLRCSGKAMVGHPDLAGTIREQQFGWIPERFIVPVPSPLLSGSIDSPARESPARKRTGIWLHGKRWRSHGNRLRSIVDRWSPEAGQLEIISQGRGRPGWARREFLIWNTDMPFEFALQRLYTWDSVLLVNDFSLDAPWLLRALQLGCFPLVPDGESPSSHGEWISRSAPEPYSWGDARSALNLLERWRKAGPDVHGDFRQWTGRILEEHPGPQAFREIWRSRKDQLLSQRPPRLRTRRPIADLYPPGWYERLIRLRAGW